MAPNRPVVLVGVARDLDHLRVIVLLSEVALLEAASTVNCMAADAAIDGARSGMTDHDVLAIAMASLQSAGVEYLTHSLCNIRRGTGPWFAAGQTLREGDAFFFDIGCYGRGGYASDIARVGFVGEPPAKARRHTATFWSLIASANRRPDRESTFPRSTLPSTDTCTARGSRSRRTGPATGSGSGRASRRRSTDALERRATRPWSRE